MFIALYGLLVISIVAPIYTYAIYPIILKLLPAKEYKRDENIRPFVSVIVAAYNEEKIIAEKIKNLNALDYPKEKIEFIIGSDGSCDRTVEIANSLLIPNLKILDLKRGGKVNALNAMFKQAKGEILVFSDANTIYESQAIKKLVCHFADGRIGCISGQLRYKIDDDSGHGAKSESTYWMYENWVKTQESKRGRLSGANGAIYAIRKSIIEQIKPGIINDDFYVATYILQAGWDVILESNAVAYEDPNNDFKSQFKRHIRDGAGHYQAIAVFWRMLLPRKGCFSYVSHRVIKWLVPFNLIVAFVANAILAFYKLPFTIMFVCQVISYATLFIYYLLIIKRDRHPKEFVAKLLAMLFYFMSVNLALSLGFVRWITKQQTATWETQR